MHRVFVTPTAREMLLEVKKRDKAAFRRIMEKTRGLQDSPEKQGKALVGPLAGFRRIVAAGRYRVIYRIVKLKVEVHIVAAGIRKEGDARDIYEIARKLINARLLLPREN
jgi:mRNA interferase RelE/StbE